MKHRSKRPKRPRKWIQGALKKHKRGSLHRQLGIPMGTKIPLDVLKWATRQPGLLGQRARLTMTLRGFRKRKRRA